MRILLHQPSPTLRGTSLCEHLLRPAADGRYSSVFPLLYAVQRLFWACFYHVNDMHVYYNMSSFIWKGMRLEPMLGTKVNCICLKDQRFAWLILVIGVVSNCLMVLTSVILQRSGFSDSCAVGFSAVLFGTRFNLLLCRSQSCFTTQYS